MKIFNTLFALFFVVLVSAQDVTATFDKIFTEKYPENGPGAAVLVAKKGKVIYRKAFGKANIENNINMRPDHIFEIGSITKQFTAVSILMLEEEGKLSINDHVKKYIPTYPNGENITILHLLNHTSGVKSYTNIPNLESFAKDDKTPMEIIAFFQSQPIDFEPGEQWRYNNSGYIVLGHIIEEISGMSYEDFVQKRIFDKLGMKNSYYGNKSRIIKNRASGYQPTQDGIKNADRISMTIPYAAGSLMSCVDDMLLWSNAIHNNTLIKASSKARAHSNTTLNNGDLTNYGYGWQINELNNKRSIEHGGGIFGFVSQGIYIPDEDIYAIVLTNTNGNSPQDATIRLASMVMDAPMYAKETTVKLSKKQLQQWTGTYEFSNDVLRFVTLENGQLYSQRDGSEKLPIHAIDDHTFYFEDSFTTYIFSNENGKKKALFKDRIQEEIGIESNKKSLEEKEDIALDPDVIKQYVGKYKLNLPDFFMTITTEGNRIFAQATGQPVIEIFGEEKDLFFLKVTPAKIKFIRDTSGAVTNVILYQNGNELDGEKIE